MFSSKYLIFHTQETLKHLISKHKVGADKDKLEDMDVSLKFALFPSGATIFTWSLWQILWTEFQAQGTK